MGVFRMTGICVGVTCLSVLLLIFKIVKMSSVTAVQSVVYSLATLHLTSLTWLDSDSITNTTSFDFIIIGGGVAGSILASRLTENGNFTVLLIEAGGDPELDLTTPSSLRYVLGSEIDWNFATEETNNTAAYHSSGGIYYPAGKMLGGSGAMFLHIHTRADPAYYDGWASALNDSSWRYDSILPYFIKSENVYDDEILSSKYASYHGTDGPIGLTRRLFNETSYYLDAFEELGNKIILDKNGRDSVGYVQPMFEILNETIQHPARVYLLPAKDRLNLFVLKNALVTKILFNKNKTATAVEVLDSNDRTWIFNARKEIIASAGALKTPQLLMLSGIGPKEHLESLHISVVADLPVGQDYQDFFGVLLAHRMEADNVSMSESPPHMAGPIFVGFPASNKSKTSYPDYLTENFILRAGGTTSSEYCSIYLGFNNDLCQAYSDAQATNNLLMTFVIKLDPKSRGKILLQSKDPTDAPLIYGGLLNNTEDFTDLVAYLQDFTPIVNTTYFKGIGAEFVKPNVTDCEDLHIFSTDYWNCYIPKMVISVFKYMSSCPMGVVVDSTLRVKEVNSLRVVDASVFPNATRAHPIATVIMMAEKAAAMILKDHS